LFQIAEINSRRGRGPFDLNKKILLLNKYKIHNFINLNNLKITQAHQKKVVP